MRVAILALAACAASSSPRVTDAAAIDAAEREAYDRLRFDTLSRGDTAFVHQHVVDAWTAQHADASIKPIAVAFALIGLCLHIERGFTGREVQLAHVELARRRKDWPAFDLPARRGEITVRDVLLAEGRDERDVAIDEWCASVWSAYAASQRAVRELLEKEPRRG